MYIMYGDLQRKGSWLTEPENGFMEPKHLAEEVIVQPQSSS